MDHNGSVSAGGRGGGSSRAPRGSGQGPDHHGTMPHQYKHHGFNTKAGSRENVDGLSSTRTDSRSGGSSLNQPQQQRQRSSEKGTTSREHSSSSLHSLRGNDASLSSNPVSRGSNTSQKCDKNSGLQVVAPSRPPASGSAPMNSHGSGPKGQSDSSRDSGGGGHHQRSYSAGRRGLRTGGSRNPGSSSRTSRESLGSGSHHRGGQHHHRHHHHHHHRKRGSSEPLDADVDGDAEESDGRPDDRSSGKSSGSNKPPAPAPLGGQPPPPLPPKPASVKINNRSKPSSMEEIVTIHREQDPESESASESAVGNQPLQELAQHNGPPTQVRPTTQFIMLTFRG